MCYDTKNLGMCTTRELERCPISYLFQNVWVIHEKCEICAQTKIVRKLFKRVSTSIEILELVHYTCDFKIFTSRGGMKYFLMFINDYFKSTLDMSLFI